jgi:glycine C-acetyltransferase
MKEAGFAVLGNPSPLVPVLLGDLARGRLVTRNTLDAGAIVNLVEYPAVARGSSRWRLQLMATHTSQQIDDFVAIAAQAAASIPEVDLAT